MIGESAGGLYVILKRKWQPGQGSSLFFRNKEVWVLLKTFSFFFQVKFENGSSLNVRWEDVYSAREELPQRVKERLVSHPYDKSMFSSRVTATIKSYWREVFEPMEICPIALNCLKNILLGHKNCLQFNLSLSWKEVKGLGGKNWAQIWTCRVDENKNKQTKTKKRL